MGAACRIFGHLPMGRPDDIQLFLAGHTLLKGCFFQMGAKAVKLRVACFMHPRIAKAVAEHTVAHIAFAEHHVSGLDMRAVIDMAGRTFQREQEIPVVYMRHTGMTGDKFGPQKERVVRPVRIRRVEEHNIRTQLVGADILVDMHAPVDHCDARVLGIKLREERIAVVIGFAAVARA